MERVSQWWKISGLSISEERTDKEKYFSPSVSKLTSISHPVDGIQQLDSKTEWCGITIWAIVPIPFYLPLSKSHTEDTYVHNIPTSVDKVRLTDPLYGCGPGVWFITIWNEPGNFCGKIGW